MTAVGTNFEAQTRNCKSNLVSRNSEVTTANPVNGAEADQNKDEEVSLLHWLKKVAKKFVTDDFQSKKALGAKGSAEIKHMEKVGISPSTHNEKDANPLPKGSGVSKQNKCYTVEKENKVPQVKPSGRCLISQKENLISKIAMMKHVCPDNVYPKMRNMISAPGKLVRSCDKKANFNRRKKKASQVEDRNSLQINWSKKGVVKKRRTTKMYEKGALDDIPMDIVELLARNQHERSLTNAEISSKNHHELSITNGEIRSGNISCVSEYCGSKDTNALYKSNALANDTVHDVPTASCGKQNTDHGTQAYNCAKYQKHIFIDLNQQATEFLTIPAYDGHQSSTTHIPVVDSKKTHSLPSSCGRIRMQDLGSHQKDGVSARSSIAGTHDMLSAPVNGRKFGISAGNIHAHCNYGKMKTVVKTTDYQEPVMLAGSHILNAGGKSEQSTNRRTQPTTSCIVGGGNRCHSGGTGPMDLSSNDMISALHLLRLVDQAALTGTSWDINCVGIAQNSNLNFTNQSSQVPVATGYSAHNQNEGNFSRPHRPVPRVGVLGSLLQKEIMTRSNKNRRTDASSSAYHTEYGDHSSQLCVTASTKTIVKAGDSPLHKFETRQVGVSKNNELIQSVRHDCTTTNCIVNRNPADFSVPDEDNIYMRGFEDVRSKCPFLHKNPCYQTHHDWKKWQAMKLPTQQPEVPANLLTPKAISIP
ncbi:embryonic flower [Musa troglodytarum]|uniref:Embryonic flower n=1 Tax=Musa troglodytarum TaxID=320322 RepID=A0A9E7HWS9_9LILI|nr:embryonic flower [Musa troglodytarum]